MASVRFIHCADLHLDRPFTGLEDTLPDIHQRIRESTFRSFQRIVDAAISRQVDFIVIAGDLYDGEHRSLRAQARLRSELERLASRGIKAYIIHGNHDHLGGDWVRLNWPEHVHFFSEDVDIIPFIKNDKVLAHIYGFSYPKRAVHEPVILKYQKKAGAHFHIGLLHGYEGTSAEHDPYAPFTVQQLIEKDFDYWALGHIHQRKYLHEDPPVIYSGNIQGLHKKEIGAKGCILVELSDKGAEHSFIPTCDVEWRQLNINISRDENIDALLDHCEQAIQSLRNEQKAILADVRFHGSGALHMYLQEEENVEDLLLTLKDGEELKKNFVWPVSSRVETILNRSRDQFKEESHFIGDLLRCIDDESTLDEAISSLYAHRKAKRYLPNLTEIEQKEILKDAETLLLTELLKS